MIATRGPSPFFGEALSSALDERPAEVIVVEDGTTGVDAREGVRLLRLEPVGRSAARNAGVRAARTPLIAFLDDDDLALPGRLERQRASLHGADGLLSFGQVRVIDGDGRPIAGWNDLLALRFRRLSRRGADVTGILATQCPIYTSATMVRREAFLAADGYDPKLDAYEDLDLYLRLAGRGRLVPCPGDPVSAYRLHGRNTPSEQLYEGALSVVAKHLPASRGRPRRLLLERELDALWGLGRFREARRQATRAALSQPRLLTHSRFAKRFIATRLPLRVLRHRR